MRPATQRERVLDALRRAGLRGVTAVDFLPLHVIDGGAPITRLASRVEELGRAGHRIERAGRRARCIVYRLAPSAPAPAAEAQVETPGLFDDAVGAAPPASAIGDWEPES